MDNEEMPRGNWFGSQKNAALIDGVLKCQLKNDDGDYVADAYGCYYDDSALLHLELSYKLMFFLILIVSKSKERYFVFNW